MSRRKGCETLLCAVMLLVVLSSCRVKSASAADAANPTTKVAGILMDKAGDSLTVKADGEDEPVKYLIDKGNKTLARSLKKTFNACRVTLTYKEEGDSRRLVSIQRQILKSKGVVTGTVVGLHNNFWLEVKPKKGPPDAFAPGGNYNNKAFMAKLRGLKPGDSVTIQYTTDSERHRIVALKKN